MKHLFSPQTLRFSRLLLKPRPAMVTRLQTRGRSFAWFKTQVAESPFRQDQRLSTFHRTLSRSWAGGCILSLLFLLIYSASWGQSFGPPTTYPAGVFVSGVAIKDVNGDGKPDIVSANVSGTVSVLLGTGTGSFGAATNISGIQGYYVAVEDVNGDGKPDIIMTGSNTVSVLLGTGTGSFGAPTSFPAGPQTQIPAVRDVNNDGQPDIIVANSSSNTVSVLLGTGTGSFGAPTSFPTDAGPRDVVVEDVNGDGRLDIITASNANSNVSVLLGTGTGSFAPATNFAVSSTSPISLAVRDVNGDGRLDIITASTANSNVSVLLGTGTGSFGPATNFPSGASAYIVAIGDANLDGKQDIFTVNLSNTVSVLLGTGTGSFGAATNFPAGIQPQALAVGDLNGDGKVDIVAGNGVIQGNSISVLLNQSVAPPTVSGFAATVASVCAGSPTTFTATVGNVTGAYNFTLTNGSSTTLGTSDSPTFSENLVASGSGSQSFTLTLSSNGQSASATTNVTVNAISPDYQPLVDLYNATNGANWQNKAGWLTGCDPCTGNGGQPWYNVGCTNGRVSRLDLMSNNLTGTIPSSLTTLTNLTVLNLFENQLSGPIPANLGALTQLTNLDLGRNQLTGGLPASLSALTNLTHLDVFHSLLGGTIPPGIGKLVNLNWLNLGESQLTDTIPASFSALTGLAYFDLSYNQLSGDVPSSLSGLTNVTYLNFGGNQLTGSISFLSTLINAQTIDLNANQFSGPVPASLANLAQLQGMNLYQNQLSGCFPLSLTALCGKVEFGANPNLPGGGNFSTFCQAPIPSASASTATPTVTVGSMVSLSATGGAYYNWTGPATFTATVANPSFVSSSTAQSGAYSVTVSNGSCTGNPTANVNVTVNVSSPTITDFAATPTVVCVGSPITLTATIGNFTGYYGWSLSNGGPPIGSPGPTSATSFSVVVSAIGSGPQTYTLTVTSNGQSTMATANVLVNSLPVATILTPASTTLTCGSPTLSLTATGGSTYRWDDNSINAVRPVSSSGTYSVTVTSASGCTAAASTIISQDNSVPMVSINPTSATLTCSSPTVSLSAIGSGAYRWSTGATTSSISATAGGPYSVTLTSTNGCTASTSAQVIQDNSVPTVNINPGSATLTCATSSVSLSATGAGTYRWNTGATTPSISATAAGPYSVTLTGSNGCTATASVQVVQDNAAPTVSISPTSATLSCTTSSVSLSAIGSGGTYRWSTGAITPAISVSLAGPYSVTLTGTNGCTASATAQVSQDNSAPTVSISPASATLSCATASVSLSAVGNGTYRWSTGATTSSISATSATTYSVTLTGANGCTATASAQIVQDTSAPSASITPSSATLTCTNPSATLTATGSGTYRWSTGATSQTISVGTANTYSLTLTAGNGCTATTSAQVTQDNSVPTVSINPNSATLSCATSSVSLSAIGAGTYRWSTGEITPAISVSTATTYSVTLTGGNGCTSTASAQVSQDSNLPTVSISANPSLTIGSGQSATLTAGGATTYGWSNGATTSVIVVNTAGTYSVTGTSGNGCSATASVVVSLTSVPAGPFAISAVTANTCQQIASNRYVISFTPVYAGTNGQPISFSVVNEVFPTTAPGPYTLQLYTDNPTITLKAQQGGTPGEVSYVYNWLAACTAPMPNTPPRVNQPLTDQIARVGEGFGYTLPQVTFTDNESPQSLVLTVSGLPTGLSFSPPTQIGGVPSVTGVSTVTVTATDPQGLSVSTSFVLTVVEPNATNTPPTLVNPIPAQVGIQGQPFSLNVGTTFTDAQTPNGLVLSVSGLPAGLNLVGTTISGTPSVSGTSTVSLTAVDPGGLSATTSFMLTIQPVSVTASGPFAITGVSPLTCTQVANNRYEISFTPRYSGVNGQAINFWVVNELVPTTAPGPYSLQLYNDNPTIVLKAKQDGSAGETTFSYNWLAGCGTPPQPNTPPRVNIPLTNQVAKVGEGFGYTIPQLTFTDNETPQSLVLTVSGLPAGMNFSPPTQIGGVPTVSGVSSVTVTATDPGGLSVYTTFSLTVLPANAPSGFAITGVQTLSCVSAGVNRRTITFTPQYSGLDGSPVSFSVVNELLPTTAAGPYTLTLYTDNATLQLRAQQGGATASYAYNWLAVCNAPTRQGVAEAGSGLQVKVLGNPIQTQTLELEINGAEGQSVVLSVVNAQGHRLAEQQIESALARQRVRLSVDSGPGVLLLQVRTATQSQTVRVVKAN